ncbi:transglutaminase-like cysteine peptidase [Qipengyuania aquimaris]|uniref:Transglutaminase-like cysteine peptidase n=1 Tax=Qipengyuania aquimaris TaxID=255984 RepID=A0A9Q3S1X2_9SPHN|nr:transglutaminase-like cysteine peptidase [Qipengyuania aquimaris]MBY6218623.1 transglutaminase-like cysteine peptidase [Qipengyuania aquimaris]
MNRHSLAKAFPAALLLASATSGLPAAQAQTAQAGPLQMVQSIPPSADCVFEERAEEPAEEAFVMPTTGFVFNLPSDEPEMAKETHHCAPPLPPPPVRPPNPSLFRMIAMPVGYEAAPMTKWDSVRLADLGDEAGPWRELITNASQPGARDPVAMVNTWVNWNVRYRDEPPGVDQWSSAPATIRRGFGDCEDFALAKMALLKAIGVPSDDMFLVLLRDRQQGEHAVLAVKQRGRLVILDNRTDMVLPAYQVEDYTPIVSYSGPFAWIYGEVAR